MRELANAVVPPVADAWGMHGDVGTGWWIVMMVGMAVFWGAVIVAAVWLLRGALQGRHAEATRMPMDVLQRRFAEGAISAEDYEQRRKLLADPDAATPAERTSTPAAARTSAGHHHHRPGALDEEAAPHLGPIALADVTRRRVRAPR